MHLQALLLSQLELPIPSAVVKTPKMGIRQNIPFLLICTTLLWCTLSSLATDVSYDGRALTIDGQRRIILSGAIHYPRSTPEMWPDLIRKAKEGGLDAIETYVFWNAHESQRGQYDFTGKNDLIRFLKVIQDEGLYAILRIGPYVCAEWNYGGFPVWLHNLPGIELRTDNQVYKNEMKRFVTDIVNMVKEESLFASQDGPIILSQIENEYGNIEWAYGAEGKEYVNWCAKMADDMHIGVPWIMCQQNDAPAGIINTCNGYYCDQFHPNNQSIPKIWTENWTGWYKDWGDKDPHRTAEDLSFAVARFFQNSGTVQSYYMYHGGTNFGRTSGGPYIVTSYDYDAPLDEYGNLNQPKYGHLKRLHEILHSVEQILTYGDSQNTDFGHMMSATKYTYNGRSFCFLGNANDHQDFTIQFENQNFTVPAWSVTLLHNCTEEVYNTAKVNAQTSVMVMRKNQEDDEPYALNWQWKGEFVEQVSPKMKGYMTANQLLDHKQINVNDTSDYVWYMTSVNMDPKNYFYNKPTTVTVQTQGHLLHIFVNGDPIGSQAATNGHFKFSLTSDEFRWKRGSNTISLLSGTVGLANYGAHFENGGYGISGPVTLSATHGRDQITRDLSNSTWAYKTGLRGEDMQFFSVDRDPKKWHTENLPINQKLTWYKTTFLPPRGDDPVVVDLKGMGKGEAWVNGQSIGRYWPTYLAGSGGCDVTCDYRGNYHPSKCNTNCGNPTQRWYHVPRSFLKDGENTLVLFEEFGGNPANVNFQTVAVGTACLHAYDKEKVELACQGDRTISGIRFASFGNPGGSCGAFRKGECEAPNTLSVIQKMCVGQKSCTFRASESVFGKVSCKVNPRRLAVQAVC